MGDHTNPGSANGNGAGIPTSTLSTTPFPASQKVYVEGSLPGATALQLEVLEIKQAKGSGQHAADGAGGQVAGVRHSSQFYVDRAIQFVQQTGLPKPLVTSSGGGFHVYWLLTDEIPSDEWRDHATRLRQLAMHYGLKADPSRTTDTSSVAHQYDRLCVPCGAHGMSFVVVGCTGPQAM